jgi:hypothetical protein
MKEAPTSPTINVVNYQKCYQHNFFPCFFATCTDFTCIDFVLFSKKGFFSILNDVFFATIYVSRSNSNKYILIFIGFLRTNTTDYSIHLSFFKYTDWHKKRLIMIHPGSFVPRSFSFCVFFLGPGPRGKGML